MTNREEIAEKWHKITAGELYLKAIEIRADYIVRAAQVGSLRIDDGPIVEEMKKAIYHYRELAWKEKQ